MTTSYGEILLGDAIAKARRFSTGTHLPAASLFTCEFPDGTFVVIERSTGSLRLSIPIRETAGSANGLILREVMKTVIEVEINVDFDAAETPEDHFERLRGGLALMASGPDVLDPNNDDPRAVAPTIRALLDIVGEDYGENPFLTTHRIALATPFSKASIVANQLDLGPEPLRRAELVAEAAAPIIAELLPQGWRRDRVFDENLTVIRPIAIDIRPKGVDARNAFAALSAHERVASSEIKERILDRLRPKLPPHPIENRKKT